MKTKRYTGPLLSLIIVMAAGLGCGLVNQIGSGADDANSNKSLTDKAVNTAVGEEKIGVKECDEVMDLLTAEANNPDDNFVVKAAKSVVINKIKESIRRSIEENKTDKAQLARDCRQAKVELEKAKAQQSGQN